jgi:hypothetical protein
MCNKYRQGKWIEVPIPEDWLEEGEIEGSFEVLRIDHKKKVIVIQGKEKRQVEHG